MKKRISMAISVETAAAQMTGAAVPVMSDDENRRDRSWRRGLLQQ